MTKQVWLAALTAAFIAGGMAVAQAQSAGGGGGAGGGGSASGGGGSDPSQFQASGSRSPYYKDERFQPMPGMPR